MKKIFSLLCGYQQGVNIIIGETDSSPAVGSILALLDACKLGVNRFFLFELSEVILKRVTDGDTPVHAPVTATLQDTAHVCSNADPELNWDNLQGSKGSRGKQTGGKREKNRGLEVLNQQLRVPVRWVAVRCWFLPLSCCILCPFLHKWHFLKYFYFLRLI